MPLSGVEAAGDGLDSSRHSATLERGDRECLREEGLCRGHRRSCIAGGRDEGHDRLGNSGRCEHRR